MKKFKLTQKTRNIISIIVIILGVAFMINYSFYKPTYVNKYIASNIYKAPAHSGFVDQNFYNCVIDSYNANNGTSYGYTKVLTSSQLSSMKYLTGQLCYPVGKGDSYKITDTTGINLMPNLQIVTLDYNNITEIDLSMLKSLSQLSLDNNKISQIDLSNNTALQQISFDHNNLTQIDLSSNTQLQYITIRSNKLTQLDISKNTKLLGLTISGNQITELNTSTAPNLASLEGYGNKISSLDLQNNSKLTTLIMNDNQLTQLKLNQSSNFTTINIEGNNININDLDLSKYTNLTTLRISKNIISSLNLSSNTKLTQVIADNCGLISLDVSKNTALQSLSVSDNQLTTVDVSKNTSLASLMVNSNQLASLDISKNTKLVLLYASSNQLTSINLNNNTLLQSLELYDNQFNNLSITKNTNLSHLSVSSNPLETLTISNTKISDLNLSSYYSEKKIKNLILENNTLLTSINVSGNELTTLNVGTMPTLKTLNASSNTLTSLDLSKNTALTSLDISQNQLSSLDLSKNISLATLNASSNTLTGIDLSKNTSLTSLNLRGNQFKNLDLSKNTLLADVQAPDFIGKTQVIFFGDSVVIPYEDNHVILSNNELNNLNRVYYKLLPSSMFSSISNGSSITGDYEYTPTSSGTYIIESMYNYTIGSRNNSYSIKSEVDVIELTSDKYRIDNENNKIIYVNDTFDVNNLSLSSDSASINYANNKVRVMHDDEVLKEFDVEKLEVVLTSEEYTIGYNYIYTGSKSFNINKVSVNEGYTLSKGGNILVIRQDNEVILTYPIVTISLKNVTVVNDKHIYSLNNNVSIDSITCTNCQVVKDNKDLVIKYNNIELDRYTVLNVNTTYEIDNNTINVGNDINDLSKLKENITSEDCDIEVTREKVTIKYNDEIIKEYTLSGEYYEFDKDLDVIDEDKIINNIKANMTVSELLELIDTDMNKAIVDGNNDSKLKTGDKLRLSSNNSTFEYTISVKGDVLGTGILNKGNVSEITKHIVNKKLITGNIYLNAADYNNDSKIKMDDVMQMIIDIKKS